MGLLPKPPIRRRANGLFEINLASFDRELLQACLDQFREALMGNDPSLRRLFPVAYLKDDDLEREYRELTHGDLLEGRFATIEVMESTLQSTEVNEAQLTAWMQSINSIRLVLGTRLDVSNDTLADDDLDDAYLIYDYLSQLIALIVSVLAAELPPPSDPDDTI